MNERPDDMPAMDGVPGADDMVSPQLPGHAEAPASGDAGALPDGQREFFATAAGGTEHVLQVELRELGLRDLRYVGAGVKFTGAWEDGWRACLHSRIAQRIMTPIASFSASDPLELYDGAHTIDWARYLTPKQTLAVAAFCRESQMMHTGYVALKVKDAIVDHLRERLGNRPRVSRDDPDVRIFVHLQWDHATVYLDLAGEPLFKRGYRQGAGEAPLKETLAAAILRLSNWDRHQPLIDPCCGSGTLAIEAALWAANIAPGIYRERFGFERWADFDATAKARMAELRGEARAAGRGQPPRITGMDIDPAMIELARTNAKAARLRLTWKEAALQQLQAQPSNPAMVVMNPPYGLRLESDPQFLNDLASLVTRLHGYTVAILTASQEMVRAIPLNANSRHLLFNGDLRCALVVYDVP